FINSAQVYIDSPRQRIVLGHAGLTIEVKSFDDRILVDVHDSDGETIGIRDINLLKRRGVHAAIRLGRGWQSLHNRHGPQIDDANLVLSPVRRVDLVHAGDVLQAGYSWYRRDRVD